MGVTSVDMKAAVLAYLRYKRQYLCATEVTYFKSYWIADIMAYNDKEVIEVEIKVSKSDLLKEMNERKGKKRKHEFLMNEEAYGQWPNRFFFAVPSSLKNDAISFIEEVNPDYGLFVYDESKNW